MKYQIEFKDWVLWGRFAYTKFTPQPLSGAGLLRLRSDADTHSEAVRVLWDCGALAAASALHQGHELSGDVLSHHFVTKIVSWCQHQHSPKELKKVAGFVASHVLVQVSGQHSSVCLSKKKPWRFYVTLNLNELPGLFSESVCARLQRTNILWSHLDFRVDSHQTCSSVLLHSHGSIWLSPSHTSSCHYDTHTHVALRHYKA